MKSKLYRSPRILAAFTLGSLVAPLTAGTIIWDGAGDGVTYTDGANWGGTAPADDLATDIAQLTGGSVDLSSTRSVSGIDMSAATTLGGSGALTVGTSGLTGAADLSLSGTGSVNFTETDGALNYTGDITVGAGTTLSANRFGLRQDGANPKTTITLDGGTLSENGGEHLELTGRDIVVTANGGTLRHVHARNIYGGYAISGAGHLTLEGQGSTAGRIQLQAANSYTGGTTVTNGGQAWLYNANSLGANDTAVTLDAGGTLFAPNNVSLQARPITVNAGTGGGGGVINVNGKSVSIAGALTGTGDLHIHSGGRIELNTSSNTFSGNVLIEGTEIRLRGSANNQSDHLGTGTITLDNNGKLKNRNNNNAVSINNDIVVEAGGGIMEAGWNRDIQVFGDTSGSGHLLIANDSSGVNFRGASTRTGTTEIQGFSRAISGGYGTGKVTLNNVAGTNRGFIQNWQGASVHTNDLEIHANGGRMKAGWGANLEFQGVTSGTGTITVEEDSGYAVLSNNANTFSGDIAFVGANSRIRVASLESTNYTGTISGAGTLDYDGTGTQTFAAASTTSYTGSTTISDGTLLVDSDLSSSDIYVRPDGTLGGLGIVGNVHFEADSKLDVTGGVLTMTDGSTLSFDDFGFDDLVGSTYMTDAEGVYTLIDDQTAMGFTLDPSNVSNWGYANALVRGDGKKVFFLEGSFAYQVIPEPSTALLGGLSLLTLLRRRRA